MRDFNGPVGNVGDHVGRYWLRLTCSECAHFAQLDPLDLLERYGNITLWSLVVRASCTKCGGRMPSFLLGTSNRVDGSDGPRKKKNP